MVSDNTKVQDGTMNATGTNDAGKDFDAREAMKKNGIYDRFDNLIKTIRAFITSGNYNAWVTSRKDRERKIATVEVMVDYKDTADMLKDKIVSIMEVTRDQVVAPDVTLELEFRAPVAECIFDTVEIEVD
ncbi:hypothetical protein [Methanobacterium paludis]|uniref:Uncharacterized protein n=1 Tax=Methanobacterium paludis (strain DSM 25820 / JCM 18151 / SWAN1) TaxID=868131 RepID=F6D2U0_METPW|nr:hypothetical protein [Methanobacterium paludis]AEG18669.1 hypothetical protein MSWAN_1658 [Methanobacterium paludis]